MTQLELYKSLLLSWDERMNLIGPEARANLDVHIEEALQAGAGPAPRGAVVKLGSGCGRPPLSQGGGRPEAGGPPADAGSREGCVFQPVSGGGEDECAG